MIYDSQEQKNFIIKILLDHHCSYAQSKSINQTYTPAIEGGPIIPVEKQQVFIDEMTAKTDAVKPLTHDQDGNPLNRKEMEEDS